jgi:hypothetical protein
MKGFINVMKQSYEKQKKLQGGLGDTLREANLIKFPKIGLSFIRRLNRSMGLMIYLKSFQM